MIAAVELAPIRPSSATSSPLLNPNTPALCANQKNPSDALRRGLRGRARGLDAHQPGRLRRLAGHELGAGDVPAGRPRRFRGLRVPTRMIGNCDGGAGDVSGVMRLQSPSIQLPIGNDPQPAVDVRALRRDRAGWDGGNVKISINGGAVHGRARLGVHRSTRTTGTLNTAAQGNTNPLAGPARLHGHGRRRGRRQLGHVADRPDADRRSAGDTIQAPLRHGHGRLHGSRRLVRRRPQGEVLQHEEERDGQEGLTRTGSV